MESLGKYLIFRNRPWNRFLTFEKNRKRNRGRFLTPKKEPMKEPRKELIQEPKPKNQTDSENLASPSYTWDAIWRLTSLSLMPVCSKSRLLAICSKSSGMAVCFKSRLMPVCCKSWSQYAASLDGRMLQVLQHPGSWKNCSDFLLLQPAEHVIGLDVTTPFQKPGAAKLARGLRPVWLILCGVS